MTPGTMPKPLAYEFLPFLRYPGTRVPTMMFVDGENLAMRYKVLKQRRDGITHLEPSKWYEPDVSLWSAALNQVCEDAGVLRRHSYTSVIGDEVRRKSIEDRLKAAEIEAPDVFKKPQDDTNQRSKGVDISLAVDMLTHAHRKNDALAILIAGDGDYIPSVKAVKAEGRRVFVWFVDERYGLSRDLRMSADYYKESA
jgi:uncharacterized LabA/DUF88 family protein